MLTCMARLVCRCDVVVGCRWGGRGVLDGLLHVVYEVENLSFSPFCSSGVEASFVCFVCLVLCCVVLSGLVLCAWWRSGQCVYLLFVVHCSL
jgi:hypothetical protein